MLKTLFLCELLAAALRYRLRHSTFELQAKTPIKSFRFFLTQFKIGEPGVIKRNSRWEIHYTTDIQKAGKKTDGKIIGCDRGYTEVYATSSREHQKINYPILWDGHPARP